MKSREMFRSGGVVGNTLMRMGAVALVAATGTTIGSIQSAGAATKTISVGSVIDRTGVSNENTIWEGEDSYFQYLNAHGGVNGYKINVVGFDTAGSPAANAADTTQLIQQDHVPVIINDDSEGGTAAVPIASKAGVPLVGNNDLPSSFESPDVFPNGPYKVSSTANAFARVFKEGGIKKVALLTLNVPIAIASQKAYGQQDKDEGMQIVSNLVFPSSQTDFTEYASKVASSGADGVMAISTQADSLAFLSALRQQGWAGKLYIFTSLAPNLAPAVGAFGNGRVVAANALLVLPPNKTEEAAVNKYHGLSGINATYSQDIAEGWTDAQIVAHAINLLGSKSPTAANIKAALQSFKNWSGTFTPPITYGAGIHSDPAHCSQVVEQIKGAFVPYKGQRETCWKGSVAPSDSTS